jgi:NAD(P)H dehydrogenase (quinone)
MNALVILAHPKPGSFNHALADVVATALVETGLDVVRHDLYAERFDPIMTQQEIDAGSSQDPLVEQHCRELAAADLVAVVHPNWWGQPPAILKGWVDRVVRQGLAYRFTEKGPEGLLHVKVALVLNTANTPLEVELRMFGDPLANLWDACTFGFIGVPDVRRRLYEPIIVSTPEQRAGWLRDADAAARSAAGALASRSA